MIGPGSILDDFRLIELLGRGGMGSVYRARQLSLDRDVAVKVVHRDLVAQPETLVRFRREVLALAGLSHPNVVKVFGGGVHHGTAYYAMELVDGSSVAALLSGKPLTLAQARVIGEGLMGALAHLHERGLVHRDVKPGNVLVGRDSVVKLSDFGLVKAAAGGTLVTEPGTLLGTPQYMPPEVLAGGEASAAGDLYSAGLVLHEVLGGVHPFRHLSLTDLVARAAERPPGILGRIRPDLPPALHEAIGALLAVDPTRRPPDARRAWAVVSSALSEASLTESEIPARVRTGAGAGTGAAERAGPRRRGRSPVAGPRASVAAAAAAALLGIALGIGLIAGWPAVCPTPVRPSPVVAVAAVAAAAAARDRDAAGAVLDPNPTRGTERGTARISLGDVRPGRRVTLPRGLVVDPRGLVLAVSGEGISWFGPDRRWRSRPILPVPEAAGILCADSRQGAWVRVRHATETLLARLDESGVHEAIRFPDAAGRPIAAAIAGGDGDEPGPVVAASGGRLLRVHRRSGTVLPLAAPDPRAPVLGLFALRAGVLGAWSERTVWTRDVRAGPAIAWQRVAGAEEVGFRIRGVVAIGPDLWVCGTGGALRIAGEGSATRTRLYLEGRDVATAFAQSGAGDAVVLAGPSGIFRQPLVPGRGEVGRRIDVPGIPDAGCILAAQRDGDEIWATTITPPALVRIGRAAVAVDALAAADPDEAEREMRRSPALHAIPGSGMPYCWADGGDRLAVGSRGQVLVVSRGPGPKRPITALGAEVWPIDLALPLPGGGIDMVWQLHGTSQRFIDRIDPRSGARIRLRGIPWRVDGPLRVSPDGSTMFQGPFIPTLLLLESGLYVRYHGIRPDLGDIAGSRVPALRYFRAPSGGAPAASGEVELPADLGGGPMDYQADGGTAVYRASDGSVVRRSLRAGLPPGPAVRIRIPGAASNADVSELALSPDGRLLAYVLQPRSTERSSLHVLDLDTQAVTAIGTYLFDYGQPRFSPGGRSLAFVRRAVDRSEAELAVCAIAADALAPADRPR
jgi:serine/threonine-protein kinase